MANSTISPNMGLIVPTVGVDPGPDWANNLNADLGILDQHNHTPGQGVPIPTSGISINADLPFNGNNATALKSVIFNIQSSPIVATAPYIGCIYFSGVDFYVNDGSGNQIRITQSGGVAGSPGSIANLTSPASATYVSGTSTFVWQSAANTPANLDAGSVSLRNITANSQGITLAPTAALASSYTLTLPLVPAAQSFLAIDTSGNITGSINISGGLTSANLSASAGITGSQLANQTVTATQIANATITTTQISASAGITTTQLANQQYSNAISINLSLVTLTTSFVNLFTTQTVSTGGTRYVQQQFYGPIVNPVITFTTGTSSVVELNTGSGSFQLAVSGSLTIRFSDLTNIFLGTAGTTSFPLQAKFVSGAATTITSPTGVVMNCAEL